MRTKLNERLIGIIYFEYTIEKHKSMNILYIYIFFYYIVYILLIDDRTAKLVRLPSKLRKHISWSLSDRRGHPCPSPKSWNTPRCKWTCTKKIRV